ncbi:hypothetical protein [Fodinibius sp. Rm-B-1B1-1]|uniref:hypothetical protein n=1 Tax=Fodinibius alkaliphilus TaxID=3140241 RepID=UPI00315A9AA7
MADTKEEKEKEIKSKVISIYQERVIRFFDYLIEHNAKISVEVPSGIRGESKWRTYTKDHDVFNYRELLGEALGIDIIDEDYKIDEFFRDSYIQSVSHQNSIRLRSARKGIIHDVHFDFKEDKPTEPRYVKGLSTKRKLFILKNFNVHRPLNVQEVYPLFDRNIRLRVLSLIDCFLNNEENSPKHHDHENYFISGVQGSAPFLNNLYMKALRNYSSKDLNTLRETYSKVSYNNVSKIDSKPFPYILPDYPTLKVPFNVCSSRNTDRKTLKEQEKLINPFLPTPDHFEDQQIWFQGTRYQTIKLKEEELFNSPVEEWPRFFAEHLILTGAEYIAIENEIIDICIDEVLTNIEFRLYNGDKNKVNLYNRKFSIDDLVELLDVYIINEGINELIDIKPSSIFSKKLKKHPNLQVIEQRPDFKLDFKKRLLFELTLYLFVEMAKHIGFYSRDHNEGLKSELDYFFDDLISG